MVIGSLTPPPIFDLQWSPSPLWWVFGSVLTKELKKPQEEEAPLTSPLWKWKSRQHGLKYQEFRTSLHSPPAPARWSRVESIAISLFGNMTVETREIHIITKEWVSVEVGFGGNLVQGFRVYAWRAVPSFPQIALWVPSLALRPQPFEIS